MKKSVGFGLLVFLVLLSSCQNTLRKAAKNTIYSAYETVGIEKRDLFKRRVDSVREDQSQASESFQSVYDRLKELYAHDGGQLERQYRRLESEFESSKSRSGDVKESFAQLETVAQDLFDEWEREIQQIQTASLKSKSRQRLNQTKSQFEKFRSSLKTSIKKMDPVLAQLQDQVLYLKHNLNAKAIGTLEKEKLRIEKDVEILLKDLQKSIESADLVLRELEQ